MNSLYTTATTTTAMTRELSYRPVLLRYAPLALLLTVLLCTCGRAPKDDDPALTENPTPPAYRDLTPGEFAEKMGEPGVVVLDVRTPAEIANGKIADAVEMDFRSPTFQQDLRALDTTKTYLVYCASGGRSARTCEMLATYDFLKLYNLKGGYAAWKQ